jgi:hypothetical protein
MRTRSTHPTTLRLLGFAGLGEDLLEANLGVFFRCIIAIHQEHPFYDLDAPWLKDLLL